jgi:hypothetical protein
MRLQDVTKKDIEDAALIADIIGGAYRINAQASLFCIEVPSRKLHDCPNCEHIEHGEYCDHHEDWDCVASAIGAAYNAIHLWLAFSNALSTTRKDRDGELQYLKREGTTRERKEHVKLYAWVDSMRAGGFRRRHGEDLVDLEVATLLREGYLPPGWRLVARHRKITTVPKSKRGSCVNTGELPTVLVRMTTSGPVAEALPTP